MHSDKKNSRASTFIDILATMTAAVDARALILVGVVVASLVNLSGTPHPLKEVGRLRRWLSVGFRFRRGLLRF